MQPTNFNGADRPTCPCLVELEIAVYDTTNRLTSSF